jgi:SAM-dependent methyltransferase
MCATTNRRSLLSLYQDRLLSDGFPRLEELGVEQYKHHQEATSSIKNVFECLSRLVDLKRSPLPVAVIGCGPNPAAVRDLLSMGYDALGIEPVRGSAEAAAVFLGAPARVLVGTAEQLPLPDNSQHVVVLEAVLEHVDSPIASIAEAFRVLVPGGVLYLTTNNRFAFRQNEFQRPFYQWYPAIVKEAYVFRHMHYDPALANFTPRPAVHWFCFSDLCRLGRDVGFAQFYSLLDLVRPDAAYIRKSLLRRTLLTLVQQNPWARALVLTFFGSAIVMLKRPTVS